MHATEVLRHRRPELIGDLGVDRDRTGRHRPDPGLVVGITRNDTTGPGEVSCGINCRDRLIGLKRDLRVIGMLDVLVELKICKEAHLIVQLEVQPQSGTGARPDVTEVLRRE